MQQSRICNINALRAQNLLLGLILPNEIKPQEYHSHSHHGVAGEMHAPGDEVAGGVFVEEDLGAYIF